MTIEGKTVVADFFVEKRLIPAVAMNVSAIAMAEAIRDELPAFKVRVGEDHWNTEGLTFKGLAGYAYDRALGAIDRSNEYPIGSSDYVSHTRRADHWLKLIEATQIARGGVSYE